MYRVMRAHLGMMGAPHNISKLVENFHKPLSIRIGDFKIYILVIEIVDGFRIDISEPLIARSSPIKEKFCDLRSKLPCFASVG